MTTRSDDRRRGEAVSRDDKYTALLQKRWDDGEVGAAYWHETAIMLAADLTAANKRIKELEGGLANAESALAIQGGHGNWNYDDYMHGMYNGMEYVLATVIGREPRFRDAPEAWLHDAAAREAVAK